MSNPGYCKSWSEQMGEENQRGRRVNKERSRSGSTGSRENARKRVKKHSGSSDPDVKKTPRKPLDLETDPDILQRRQKQIDYGRNTTGYFNYRQQVPVDERTKEDPKTPDKYAKYSRRSWDMLIKIWRKKLHEYDTDQVKGEDNSDHVETDEEHSEN